MHFINPVEALQLHYSALETIDDGAIAEAKRKFAERLERQGETALQYHGRVYTQEQFEASFELLDIPNALSAFYRLYRYPRLNGLLSGDAAEGEVEYRALSDEEMMAVLKPILTEKWSHAWVEAVATQNADAIKALQQTNITALGLLGDQLLAPTDAYFEQKLAELEQFTAQMEANPLAPIPSDLMGAYWFQKNLSAPMMRALPQRFDRVKEAVTKKILRICKAIYKQQPAMAEGLLIYALEFLPDGDTRKLATDVRQRIKGHRVVAPIQRAPQSGGGAKTVLGVLASLILIVGFGIKVWRVMDQLSDRSSSSYNSYKLDRDEIKRQEAIAEQYSNQHLERLVSDSIAYSEIGDISRPHGLAPLKHCQTPRPRLQGTMRKLTITGDENYDAIVLLYNGDRNVGQVYVAAGQKAVWQGHVKGSPISTLIVFGKDWSTKQTNPCGEPGWFAGKILYAGFASYATFPYPVEFDSGHTGFELRRSQLHKTRELTQERFFELAQQYR
jgi:hypothetical protein